MVPITRVWENPILKPNPQNPWEAVATFNGCVTKDKGVYHMVYRAQGNPEDHLDAHLSLSSIGIAMSPDGVIFTNRKQLIQPDQEWDRFGCEDPRITKMNGKYYIFYTALSHFPFSAESIKVGVATSKDLETIDEKHLVTPFNAKAMSMFPEKINGKFATILTAHTDKPPSKIAVAFFDHETDIWNENFWDEWYADIDTHTIPLLRSPNDHVEVGAPPVKTKFGWLLVYCYIRNYLSQPRTFGIEAVLLDLNDPRKIIGRTKDPLLVPEEDYEVYGAVPNVIFPSGSLINRGELWIYYGATDSSVCLAKCKVAKLMADMLSGTPIRVVENEVRFERFRGNPIILPNPEHPWESRFTLNPAAVYENGKVHILYRAQGHDGTSVIGYASSHDGVHIDERLDHPIYTPREPFEMKAQTGFSGCEDPRLTRFGDRLYMCYTAFDGKNPTRVAMTSIPVTDFVNKNWNWEKPILISDPNMDDKNAGLFPEKINGKYVFLHRINPHIWIDTVDTLDFTGDKWLKGQILMSPGNIWDTEKIGIAAPPLLTKEGWLLIYHALSKQDHKYRLGAALLEYGNPTHVLSRLDYPILEPKTDYEMKGLRGGTVFACGMVVIKNQLFIYYGGADQFVSVASVRLSQLVNKLVESH